MREDALKKIIEYEIKMFTRDSPANRMKSDGGPYFEGPLVGFADASDPLFQDYKRIIGDFHATPRELFEAEFGRESFSGGTVISWVLPIAAATRKQNRKEKVVPAESWSHTRWFGEMFNEELRRHVAAFLAGLGFRTLAPVLTKGWQRFADTPVGHASTWSERHAAYAAGLGTFSLNDGLITERGIAQRCGSVVTELVLDPSKRPYRGIRDYCLYFSEGTCGACIGRCPAGAISVTGHDKARCFAHMRQTVMPRVSERYGVEVPGCGLCQTKVPCEERIPRPTRRATGRTRPGKFQQGEE